MAHFSVKNVLLPGPIGFLLLPDFASVAFAAMIETVRVVNRYLAEKCSYMVMSNDGLPCPDTSGLPIGVQGGLELCDRVQTLVVCANIDALRFADDRMIALLRRLVARKVKLGSMDAGAFVLARAGLFDGHRMTLHWEDQPAFKEQFPSIEVTENLFEFDRNRFSCAGGTAGIDMVLHAVRAEHGGVIAQRVSEHFLVDRIRDEKQPQRTDIPVRFGVHHPKVALAIELMEEQLDEPLAVGKVAEAAGLSSRQLLRLFRDQIGTTPAKLYLHLRLERSRRLLRQSDMSVLDVAVACGFESPSHFTRAYRKQFGHPPRGERRPSTSTSGRLLVLDPPVATAPPRPKPAPFQQAPPKLK